MIAMIVAVVLFYVLAGKSRVEMYLSRNTSADGLRDDLRDGLRRARIHVVVLVLVWPFWHPFRLGAE